MVFNSLHTVEVAFVRLYLKSDESCECHQDLYYLVSSSAVCFGFPTQSMICWRIPLQLSLFLLSICVALSSGCHKPHIVFL